MIKTAANITYQYALKGIHCDVVIFYGLAITFIVDKVVVYKMTIDFKARNTLIIEKAVRECSVNSAFAFIHKIFN